MATESTPLSPRMAALRHALAGGDDGALERFWDEVSERGAPLVEPIPGDDHHVLVTFLWRATEPVTNVVLVNGLATWGEFAANQLTRLADSDLWYRTYRAAADIRTTYLLAPNDSLIRWEDFRGDQRDRMATWQPDPLNPRRFVRPKDDENPERRGLTLSVLELPAAPPQPWVAKRPGIPRGRLERHRLRSALLGNERRVWVYTPPSYSYGAGDPPGGVAGATPSGARGAEPGEPPALLLLFDGWAYTRVIPLPTILDNLQAEGRLPPVVAVLPDEPDSRTRRRELSCDATFNAFLLQELLPWVRQRYRITQDPRRTVVGGSSAGGLAAAFAALHHPDAFGNVLSQSGPFFWRAEGDREPEWLIRQYVAAPRRPLRFFLDVGLLDTGPNPRACPNQVVSNRHMRDVLQAKGYPVHYLEFHGAHDHVCWQGTLADGLLALLGPAAARAGTG